MNFYHIYPTPLSDHRRSYCKSLPIAIVQLFPSYLFVLCRDAASLKALPTHRNQGLSIIASNLEWLVESEYRKYSTAFCANKNSIIFINLGSSLYSYHQVLRYLGSVGNCDICRAKVTMDPFRAKTRSLQLLNLVGA